MDKKSITKTSSVAESFNRYFAQIGPNLTKDIGISTRSFNECVAYHGTTQPENVICVNEFKDPFFSLKINESVSYDDISFNVVKNVFEFHINLSCTNLIFLYKLAFFQINSRLLGLHHCLRAVENMN